MSEGDDARAFREGIASGKLFIGPHHLTWETAAHGMYADIPIEDAPSDTHVYVRVRFNARPGSYSVNLFWNATRLYGFDIDGDPHTNARGRSIRTPHRQFYRDDGVQDTEAVDVVDRGIISCARALQYVLDWCGLESGHQWSDPPPLQRNTSNTTARVHTRGGPRR